MHSEVLVSRRALVAAGILAALIAAVAIGVVARFDVGRMTYGDGLIYRGVAEHLTASPAQADELFAPVGTQLRFGRIGLPVLLFVGSGGQRSAMPYVQPVIMIIAAGFIGAAARKLLPRLGWLAALLPFAAVGLTASMLGGYQEPLAVAFGLWAVVFAREERWVESAVLLGCAMLVRENAAVLMVGLVGWNIAARRLRGAAILASSVGPVVAWHAFVWVRFGALPLLDPHLRGNNELGPPFIALWRSLHINDPHVVAAIGIHVILAVLALTIARRSEMGAMAAVAAFFVVWNGPPQWFNVGDGVRLQVFLELFVILGVASIFSAAHRTSERVIELDQQTPASELSLEPAASLVRT